LLLQRFVLDDRTHPINHLIHPKLEQYQGPALLAYNNALFTENDFKNLSRLGDSLKLNDGSTTGRFGRGFNSVALPSNV
jgi:sacsin